MTSILADSVSPLQQARSQYQPKLPDILKSGAFELVEETTASADPVHADEIRKLFPNTFGKPILRVRTGKARGKGRALNVGVVLSGGPAPGGHNCIVGLFDALQAANPDSRLVGFLDGPKGIVDGHIREITADVVDQYKNTGGFDMIGSGRDKIESVEDLDKCIASLKSLGIESLVVIGGDDSNTNASVLAEYFLAQKTGITVIGLPKTIDGDMKNEIIEASFGFDTAAKTFSELVGNVCRDSLSARKYWHFIKLMGRAASHVALEVALQTHPNICIISEEVEAKGLTLSNVVDQIVDAIVKRSESGRNYGVVVVPEGLLEFLVDFKDLLKELGLILKNDEAVLAGYESSEDRRQFVNSRLSKESSQVYFSLPDSIQAVLLHRDKHGNIPVSQVETEKLLIDLVMLKIQAMKKRGQFGGSFSAIPHFFGYEGRCVAPSNFDADYTYTLGYTAVQLIEAGYTGYTVFASDLEKPAAQWGVGGVPVTSMLNMEMRKGKLKPVIRKALVQLDGAPFKAFTDARDNWAIEDAFLFPGPVQFFGPSEVCDQLTITLSIEKQSQLG